jgi:hypothetical protein
MNLSKAEIKAILLTPSQAAIPEALATYKKALGVNTDEEVIQHALTMRKINRELDKQYHIQAQNLELSSASILLYSTAVQKGDISPLQAAHGLFLISEADLSKFER